MTDAFCGYDGEKLHDEDGMLVECQGCPQWDYDDDACAYLKEARAEDDALEREIEFKREHEYERRAEAQMDDRAEGCNYVD